MMQISSVDYVYQDGKKVHSTRLPGFSGAAGLDDESESDQLEMLDEADLNGSNAGDMELVCLLLFSKIPTM